MTTPPHLVTTREALAEALSWTSGEMTRWSESAHPDHNRWSWRGDGHGEARREEFRAQADALLASGAVVAVEDLAADEELVVEVERGMFASTRHPEDVEIQCSAIRSTLAEIAAALTARAETPK